jgi:hypothetical protein
LLKRDCAECWTARSFKRSTKRYLDSMESRQGQARPVSVEELEEWITITYRHEAFQALRDRGFGVTVLLTGPKGEVTTVSALENPAALRAQLEKARTD